MSNPNSNIKRLLSLLKPICQSNHFQIPIKLDQKINQFFNFATQTYVQKCETPSNLFKLVLKFLPRKLSLRLTPNSFKLIHTEIFYQKNQFPRINLRARPYSPSTALSRGNQRNVRKEKIHPTIHSPSIAAGIHPRSIRY